MTEYNQKTEDQFGRQIKPVVTNTKAGGSGDWIFPAGKGDSATGASLTIDYAHHEIHEGSAFVCHYVQTVSDTDDKSIIAFKTGSTKYVHCLVSASASTAAVAYIYEAPTITDNTGASLDVFNRRRVGTPEATTIIRTNTNPDEVGAMYFTEATMGELTGGTELAHIPLIAGAGPKPIGATARATQEWILKPDTLYAFVVNSSTDSDNTHWIEVDWYEHEE